MGLTTKDVDKAHTRQVNDVMGQFTNAEPAKPPVAVPYSDQVSDDNPLLKEVQQVPT